MKPQSKSRAGKTLIEMLVIIVSMSVVLSTAGQMLFRLSRSERAVRDASAIARTEMRLARLFRTDARASFAAERLAEPQQGLRFTTADGTITYEFDDGSVRRSWDAGTGAHRDRFVLGSVNVAFDIDENELAILAVEPQAPDVRSTRSSAGPLRIAATIGADAFGESIAERPESEDRRAVEATRPEPEEAP